MQDRIWLWFYNSFHCYFQYRLKTVFENKKEFFRIVRLNCDLFGYEVMFFYAQDY